MHAEGQAIAGCVDRADHLLQIGCLIADDVQDRAEVLFLQLMNAADLERHRCHEVTLEAFRQQGFGNQLALAFELSDMRVEASLSFGVDHRAHIALAQMGRANLQLGHRALEQLQYALGDIGLHIHHAQC